MRETEILRGLGKARTKMATNKQAVLHMAGGGVVPETTDQIIARMKASYGTDGSGMREQAAAPAPAPAPAAPAPAPQPQSGGLLGIARAAMTGRADQIRAATGFRNGTAFVPGHGSGDKVPAMLEPGEAVLPKQTVAHVGKQNIARLIANTHNGTPPQRGGLRAGQHFVNGYTPGGVDPEALKRAQGNADYATAANATPAPTPAPAPQSAMPSMAQAQTVLPPTPAAPAAPVDTSQNAREMARTAQPAPAPAPAPGVLSWGNRVGNALADKLGTADAFKTFGVDRSNLGAVHVGGGLTIGVGPGSTAGRSSLLGYQNSFNSAAGAGAGGLSGAATKAATDASEIPAYVRAAEAAAAAPGAAPAAAAASDPLSKLAAAEAAAPGAFSAPGAAPAAAEAAAKTSTIGEKIGGAWDKTTGAASDAASALKGGASKVLDAARMAGKRDPRGFNVFTGGFPSGTPGAAGTAAAAQPEAAKPAAAAEAAEPGPFDNVLHQRPGVQTVDIHQPTFAERAGNSSGWNNGSSVGNTFDSGALMRAAARDVPDDREAMRQNRQSSIPLSAGFGQGGGDASDINRGRAPGEATGTGKYLDTRGMNTLQIAKTQLARSQLAEDARSHNLTHDATLYGHDTTGMGYKLQNQSANLGHAVTARGNDLSHDSAIYGHDVSKYGHDIQNKGNELSYAANLGQQDVGHEANAVSLAGHKATYLNAQMQRQMQMGTVMQEMNEKSAAQALGATVENGEIKHTPDSQKFLADTNYALAKRGLNMRQVHPNMLPHMIKAWQAKQDREPGKIMTAWGALKGEKPSETDDYLTDLEGKRGESSYLITHPYSGATFPAGVTINPFSKNKADLIETEAGATRK